jgi:chromosome segregation ATPase
MSSVGELVFALERFEATDADRLEVVGRWQGLEGRRLGRPVLTVLTEGGRRRRLTALPGGQLTASGADAPWRASFAWDGDPASVESAELELGRRLVVELPRPRRRRRRALDTGLRPATAAGSVAAATAAAGDDVRSQLAELRAQVEDLRRERDAAAAPLAELREQHGALEDDHAAAAREAEDLRGERDAARAELARIRETLASTQAQLETARTERDAARGETGTAGSELQRLRSELDALRAELETTRAALEATRAELTAAQGDVAERDHGIEAAVAALEAARREHEKALAEARADADRRVDDEREASAGLREKLAAAREDAERAKHEAAAAIEAEARETEKLRLEARSARDEAEQTVAGERAEAARLREELAGREPPAEGDGEDTAARRMLDRVSRDLERERAASRTLRREIDMLRGESAQHRRLAAAAAAAGVATTEEATVAAGRRNIALRDEVSRVSAKRIEASAAGRTTLRVPEHGPSTPARWGARVVGLVLAGLLLLALAIIVLQVAG